MKKPITVLFLLSCVFTVLLFLPYSVNIENGVTNVIDPLFYAWNLAHNASHAFGGFNALLNTNIFYPLTNTLSFSDTLWGQSILTNPIIWLTGNPILAENIAVLISFPFAALFMYLLSMYLTRNRTASMASGIFFAFSYPRLSQIGHLPMITSQWLPLYLLFLFRFLNEGKRMNFFLLCVSYILSIASSIYFGIFLIPITAIILIADFFKRIRAQTLRSYPDRIRTMFPSLPLFLIMIFIVMMPYIRLKIENPELKRSIDNMTHLRATPLDYVSILPTSLIAPVLPTSTNEHVLYPTLTLVILALFGSIVSWKRNRYMVGLCIAIVLSSVVLSLGDQQGFSIGTYSTGTLRLPYYYLYTYLPIFQAIRVPARFAIFVILALSMLSSFGISEIMKRKHARWIISIFLSFFILEIWQVRTSFMPIPLKNTIPHVYTWIAQQPEPMILAEVPVSLFYHGKIMEDQLNLSYDALKSSDIYALETYRVYFSAFHKKRMLNGYSGFLPDTYNKLAEMLESFPSENTILDLRANGITHIVVHRLQFDPVKRGKILSELHASSLVTPVFDNSLDFVYEIVKNTKTESNKQ